MVAPAIQSKVPPKNPIMKVCMPILARSRLLPGLTVLLVGWAIWYLDGDQPGSRVVRAGSSPTVAQGQPAAARPAVEREGGSALARTGWAMIDAGDYPGALQAFEEAARQAPEEASVWLGLGLSQHRLFRDDLAVAALERAIRLNFHVNQGHKLLGDAYAQRGAYAQALRHYQTALEQDPNDVWLKERLATASREYQAEANVDRLFSEHFVVRFSGPLHRIVASDVAERLETAYREIGRRLSYFPTDPFTVILYPEGQFGAMTLSPGWARGLFDGRMHVPAEGIARPRAPVDTVLRHEYVHALVHRLSGGRSPAWLSEGLALHFEGGAQVWSRDFLMSHLGEVEPLSTLQRGFLERSPRAATVAYAQSYWAAHAMIQRYGLARVRDLLAALSGMPDFREAFETVLPDSYREFEATWLAGGTTGRD